jgi:hypothetical protein
MGKMGRTGSYAVRRGQDHSVAEDGVSVGVKTPDENDPIRVILARALKNSDSAESSKLVKAVLSIISDRDEISVAELCSLSEEMLCLLDAFARNRMAGAYEQAFLEGLSNRLRSQCEVDPADSPLAA